MNTNLVLGMLSAYENAAFMYVMAKLNIADYLSEKPRSSKELALLTETNADALHRVLRGLVNRKILFEDSLGHFGLTSDGECLKSNAEGDIHGIALNIGELLYNTWGSLLYSVKTGKPAFEHIHGINWFDFLKQNPKSAEIFNRGMANNTLQIAQALCESYDFSNIQTITDIGGGHGILLKIILEKYTHLKAVLFDSPEVIQEIKEEIKNCEFKSGNFFESVPKNKDIYILKSIIHDWNDEEALRILQNCREVMHENSKILLIEPIMPERLDEFSLAVEMDLGMLLLLNGRERTSREYENLYARAGFELTRIISIMEPYSVIEARPCK